MLKVEISFDPGLCSHDTIAKPYSSLVDPLCNPGIAFPSYRSSLCVLYRNSSLEYPLSNAMNSALDSQKQRHFLDRQTTYSIVLYIANRVLLRPCCLSTHISSNDSIHSCNQQSIATDYQDFVYLLLSYLLFLCCNACT